MRAGLQCGCAERAVLSLPRHHGSKLQQQPLFNWLIFTKFLYIIMQIEKMNVTTFLSLLILFLNEIDLLESFRMFNTGKVARRMPFTQQVVTIRSDIYEPAMDAGISKEHLIDEEMVSDDLSASLLADR